MATVDAASDMLYVISNVVTWNMVREATADDATLSFLMEHLQGGFPNQSRDLPLEHRPFQRYADSLCCVDGVILMGNGIVIRNHSNHASCVPSIQPIKVWGPCAQGQQIPFSGLTSQQTSPELERNALTATEQQNQTQCNPHVTSHHLTTHSRGYVPITSLSTTQNIL